MLCAATARAQDITWTDVGNGTHVIDDSLGFEATEYSFVSKFTRGESVSSAEADRFGASVSIDGDTFAVGRPHHWDNREYVGEVWIYARDTPGDRKSSWSLIQIVRAPDGAAGDYFAGSLDLDGDTLVVGAAQDEPHGADDRRGLRVRLHAFDEGRPFVALDVSPEAAEPDARTRTITSGWPSPVDGDVVIVGTPKRDQSADGKQVPSASLSGDDVGAVFVFARAVENDLNSDFVYVDRLETADLAVQDEERFGTSVAVHGDVLVATTAKQITINADTDDQFCAMAHVFVRKEVGVTHSRWEYKTTLKVDACETLTMRKPVAVYGDTIVVGAPDEDHIEVDSDGNSHTHDEAGRAHVFTRDVPGDVNSEWSYAFQLNAEVFSGGDNFGSSVGIWEDTIAVGASAKDEHATWNEDVRSSRRRRH
jgi:hypothetical protein